MLTCYKHVKQYLTQLNAIMQNINTECLLCQSVVCLLWDHPKTEFHIFTEITTCGQSQRWLSVNCVRSRSPRTLRSGCYSRLRHGGKSEFLRCVALCRHLNVGPCHHSMTRPHVADGGDGLKKRRVAANILVLIP
jgi:hypothetical protein